MGDGNAKGFLALPSRGLDTDPNIEEAVNSFFNYCYCEFAGLDGDQ